MDVNQNTKGIFFIMTGMAFFSIQDSLIKFIFEDIALFELYFGRTISRKISRSKESSFKKYLKTKPEMIFIFILV